MKKRTLAAGMIALGLWAGTAGAMAAQEPETDVQQVSEMEMDAAQAESETQAAEQADKDVLAVITLQAEGKDPLEMANTAGLDITAVSVESAGEGDLVNISMAAKDGTVYEFLNLHYDRILKPELVQEGAFAFIRYTSLASGKEDSVGQEGEISYDEPVELYAVDDVYIRSTADDESDILGVISRGDAISVLGETATHYIVKKDDVTGYTVRKCVSEDEQDAIAAVAAEKAAREAIAAAEAAAAAAAPQGGGVTEVRRQRFEDCDGSGHGYYLITYSDGSTGTEEF